MKRVHSLLNTGHNEVVDRDLSDYFGEIPHAELLKSFARRISDGRMLGLIKAWLEMAVEADDGNGGKRRTNRALKERKGVPQGAPISPLASNLYMRRFILGWKVRGYARHFRSQIVNYADDLCVLGKAPAAQMLRGARAAHDGTEATGQRTENPMPAVPRGSLRVPPGYRIGRVSPPDRQGGRTSGIRPSKASVRRISRKDKRHDGAKATGWQSPESDGETPESDHGRMGRITSASGTSSQPYSGRQSDTRFGGCVSGSVESTRTKSGNFVRIPSRQATARLRPYKSLTRQTLGLPSAKA